MSRPKHKKLSTLLALICAAMLILPVMAQAASGNSKAVPGPLSEPVYQVITENIEIPARDGAYLRGVVYRPAAEGQYPAILITSPYNAPSHTIADGDFYGSRGYAYVAVDSRGRFTSDGLFSISEYHGERNDIYDTLDWIAAQAWCNGKVAGDGRSYPGATALQTAVSGHPNLVCSMVGVTTGNMWREWHYRGGAFELGFLSFWGSMNFAPSMAEKYLTGTALEEVKDTVAMYSLDPSSFLDHLPLYDWAPMQVGDVNLFKDWLDHPSFDQFWAEKSADTYAFGISVPVLHVGGWYDIFSNGTMNSYLRAVDGAYTQFARDNQYLIMSPTVHYAALEDDRVDQAFGAQWREYAYENTNFQLGFFDYWLKDTITPAFDPDVHVIYYTTTTNGGHYNQTNQWPLPEVVSTPFYLNGGTSGSIASLNDGTLSRNPSPAGEQPQTYAYNPMDPTLSLGGTTLFLVPYGEYGSEHAGRMPQQEVDVRSLTFTSAPLTEDLEIAGKIAAVLFASSDAVDTDFVVRLNDVTPDGTSINIQDGILRARYRNSPINPTLMEPGEIYRFEIDMWSVAHIFEAGHSIRVTVNSSSFPRWSRNMNVAEQPEKATDWVVANNTIYLDAEHPSHVILPVVSK